MRRHPVARDLRTAYIARVRRLVEHFGRMPDCPWPRELRRLESGRPVVVQDGGCLDGLRPGSGPWCLERDGKATPLRPVVLVDPAAECWSVGHYLRPDGTRVA